jgi:hypothetical protein
MSGIVPAMLTLALRLRVCTPTRIVAARMATPAVDRWHGAAARR